MPLASAGDLKIEPTRRSVCDETLRSARSPMKRASCRRLHESHHSAGKSGEIKDRRWIKRGMFRAQLIHQTEPMAWNPLARGTIAETGATWPLRHRLTD
jgi:hypothetical protein